jgi:SAM-dependent methyltransferase
MYYDAKSYGEVWADSYDQHFPSPTEGSLELIRELAGTGPVLELGPGTGRMAGPLAAGGLTVHGVEASEAMIARLRERWGPDIKVVGDDFSHFSVQDSYSLAFVVFNTFFALLTQDAQVNCMQCVADALKPGGQFLMELFVPDLGRFDRGQRLATIALDESLCRLEASVHNLAEQQVESQIVSITSTGINLKPIKLRYAWPAEVDLMARMAGLERVHRWGGWQRQPFSSDSNFHVTVYRKPS